MAKDAPSRYGTAQELADDLRRFLDDRAILACPPPPLDQARRWVRKHWTMVATAAAVLVAASAVGSALLLAEQAKTSSALTKTTTALRQAEERLLLNNQAMDATVLAAQNLTMRAMETVTDYGSAVLRKQDVPFFELALHFYEELERTLLGDPDPHRREMLAKAYFGLGLTKMMLVRTGAEDAYAASVRMYEGLIEEQPHRVNLLWHLAASKAYLAMNLARSRDFEEAQRLAYEVVDLERQMVAREPASSYYQLSLTMDLLRLGGYLSSAGRPEEAERALREVLERDPKHHLAMNNLAWLLAFDPSSTPHDPREAATLARKAIAAKPMAANYHNTLGVALIRLGDWDGAADALATSMRLSNGGNPHDLFLMALVHAKRGEKAKAKPLYEKALNGLAKLPADPELALLHDEAAVALDLMKPRPRLRARPPKAKPKLVAPAAETPSVPAPEGPPRGPVVRMPTRPGDSLLQARPIEPQ